MRIFVHNIYIYIIYIIYNIYIHTDHSIPIKPSLYDRVCWSTHRQVAGRRMRAAERRQGAGEGWWAVLWELP